MHKNSNKRAANKQAKEANQQQSENKNSGANKEQIAKVLAKLSPEEQNAFKLYYNI